MAITYDNSASLYSQNTTHNLTLNNSGNFVIVAFGGYVVTGGGLPSISSCTYSTSNMTLHYSVDYGSTWRGLFVYRLVNPPTGNNTLSIVTSASSRLLIAVASYYGVNQSSPIAASGATSVSSTTASITGLTSGFIFSALYRGNDETITAGSGQTKRQNPLDALMNRGMAISDESADTQASFSWPGSGFAGMWACTLAPGGMPGVKTINGIANADIKTVNGIVVADIKSIQSLT